jgi:hypothetical protein
MTNSFQCGSRIASRSLINYRILGEITTMVLHGKSFLFGLVIIQFRGAIVRYLPLRGVKSRVLRESNPNG